MRIRFDISTEFYEKEVLAAVDEALMVGLMMCGFVVETEAKRGLNIGGGKPSKSAKGRPHEYYNSARHGYVIGSSPPNPPHTQTGNLKGSIATARTNRNTVIIGPTRMALYGKYHEKGKRPFMVPALRRAAPKFKRICKLALQRTTHGYRLNARRYRR